MKYHSESAVERRRRLGLVQIEKQDIDDLADEFVEAHMRFWTLATLDAFIERPGYYRKLAAKVQHSVNNKGIPLYLILKRLGNCAIALPTTHHLN